jgi:hypothetical protein
MLTLNGKSNRLRLRAYGPPPEPLGPSPSGALRFLIAVHYSVPVDTRQPLRARFHLRGRDAATVELRGMEVVREHADELSRRSVRGPS